MTETNRPLTSTEIQEQLGRMPTKQERQAYSAWRNANPPTPEEKTRDRDAFDYQRIEAMDIAGLVHTMMVEFRPIHPADGSKRNVFLQNNAYYYAYERLKELTSNIHANKDENDPS